MVVLYIIDIVLIFSLFVYLIVRFVQLYKSIQRDVYDVHTTYTFICSKCDESHTVNGTQFKDLRWKPRIETSTTSGIRFQCPHCLQKATQKIQYDHDQTKMFGLFRLQMNESQKQHLLRFLLLGFAPIIIIIVVWNIVKAIITPIVQFFT